MSDREEQYQEVWHRITPYLNKLYESQLFTKRNYLSLRKNLDAFNNLIYTNRLEWINSSSKCSGSVPKFEDDLYFYKFFQSYVCFRCTAVYVEMDGLKGTELLRTVTTKWMCYQQASYKFNVISSQFDPNIFGEYADTIFLKTYNLSLLMWKLGIITHYRDRINEAVFHLVDQERNGVKIDGFSLFIITTCYHDLGLYESYFNKEFLMLTDYYYKREAARKIIELPISEYLVHIEKRLSEESLRLSQYCRYTSEESVNTIIDNNFVREHLDTLQAEFKQMLVRHRYDDLGNLIVLVSQNLNDLLPFHKVFLEYVRSDGSATLQGCSGDLSDPKLFVTEVLKVYRKYEKLVKNAFGGSDKLMDQFLRTLKLTVASVLNKSYPRISFLVAKYSDLTLKKATNRANIEETLEDIATIVPLIYQKDVFQEYLAKFLSKRLINRQSSRELEISFVAKVRPHIFIDYAIQLETMLKDIQVSEDISADFCSKSIVPLEINFSCMVLKASAWLFQQSPCHCLPCELEKYVVRFSEYYKEVHSGKKLQWLHHISSGDVVSNCFKRSYTITLSTWQMAVLMLYNKSTTWTLSEIQEQTQLEMETLKQIIATFFMAKLMTCPSAADNLQPDSEISLNEKYNNKNQRINITVPLKSNPKKEEMEVDKSVKIKRKILCECAIMRVLKARQRVSYNDLVETLIPEIRKHYHTIPTADIKQSIALLIKKSYIAECPMEKDFYVYVR